MHPTYHTAGPFEETPRCSHLRTWNISSENPAPNPSSSGPLSPQNTRKCFLTVYVPGAWNYILPPFADTLKARFAVSLL